MGDAELLLDVASTDEQAERRRRPSGDVSGHVGAPLLADDGRRLREPESFRRHVYSVLLAPDEADNVYKHLLTTAAAARDGSLKAEHLFPPMFFEEVQRKVDQLEEALKSQEVPQRAQQEASTQDEVVNAAAGRRRFSSQKPQLLSSPHENYSA